MKDLTGVPDEEKHKHVDWHAQPTAKERVKQLSQTNSIINQALSAVRFGKLSYEEALETVVVALADANKYLHEELINQLSRAAPQPLLGSGVKFCCCGVELDPGCAMCANCYLAKLRDKQ